MTNFGDPRREPGQPLEDDGNGAYTVVDFERESLGPRWSTQPGTFDVVALPADPPFPLAGPRWSETSGGGARGFGKVFEFSARLDPFTHPWVMVKIRPDPLGGPNSIIRLVTNDGNGVVRQVGKAVLYPVGAGTEMKMGRDRSTMVDWLLANPPLSTWKGQNLKPDVWFVEVDGKRILEVPYHEVLPPIPPPVPVPRLARLKRWVKAQPKRLADKVADRFGYVHHDDIDYDDY